MRSLRRSGSRPIFVRTHPKTHRHSRQPTQQPTEAPSIGRTATPVWRNAKHHHPGLNQTNDKRRATHYLESDTDMLSVSGGFGGGTFRRPPYCKRYLGITMPISKSADARRVLEHHQNTRPEEKKSPTIMRAANVPGLNKRTPIANRTSQIDPDHPPVDSRSPHGLTDHSSYGDRQNRRHPHKPGLTAPCAFSQTCLSYLFFFVCQPRKPCLPIIMGTAKTGGTHTNLA